MKAGHNGKPAHSRVTLIISFGFESSGLKMPPQPTRLHTADSETANSSDRAWSFRSAAFLIPLIAVAAGFRFLFLVQKPFWFDEAFSVEVARLSGHDFTRLLWWREANMSLYYILLRGWLHFGSTPYFIRSLSVIFSLASLTAVFWLAATLFDRRVAWVAAALMSVNAFSIRYAQEARSYSLFVLLATLSSGFLVANLKQPSRRNRWGYILTSVLAVYAHFYAVLLLASHWLSMRGRRERGLNFSALRRAWIWIGVAVAPLLVFAAKTGAGPIRWIPRPGFHDLFEFAEHLAGNDGSLLLLSYVAAGAFAVFSGKRAIEPSDAQSDWRAWRLRFLLVWLFFPVALTLLLSVARPLFLGRYFAFCLPALIILAAAGLVSFRKNWLTALGVAAMLLLSIFGTFAYYRQDFDLERDGSEAATNYILDHAQAGDVIMFHIAEARVPYELFKSLRTDYLSTGNAVIGPEIIYPRHGNRLEYRDFTGKPTPDFVQSLRGRYSRIWLVLMSNGSSGHPDATTTMLNQTLGASFKEIERDNFPQTEVRLYQGR
jgi:mannosyltransferase